MPFFKNIIYRFRLEYTLVCSYALFLKHLASRQLSWGDRHVLLSKFCRTASFLLDTWYILIQFLNHIHKWAKWLLGLMIAISPFCTEPPPVIQVPSNATVAPGERAVLTCLVISAVGYNLTWQRNDRDVRLADPARMRLLANLSLELRTVKVTDAGEYQCLVSSEGGSSAASVFLTVQGTVLMITSTV